MPNQKVAVATIAGLIALVVVLVWIFGSGPSVKDSDHKADCWTPKYALAHMGGQAGPLRRHCAFR